MALKALLESLEGIPESIPRSEIYSLDPESGSYRVMLDQAYELDSAIEPLRSANKKNRDSLKERERELAELKQRLEGYGEFTPEQVKELQTQIESIRDKKVLDDEGVERLVDNKIREVREAAERDKQALAQELAKEKEDKAKISSDYKKYVLENKVIAAFGKMNGSVRELDKFVVQTAREENWTVLDDGRLVQLDLTDPENPDIAYGPNGTPKDITDWLQAATRDESKWIWFGGGTGPGMRNNRAQGAPHIDLTKLGMGGGRQMVDAARAAGRS